MAAGSGLLLTAAFPKIGWDFLAWVALIPLMLAVAGQRRIGAAFRMGYIAGLVHFTSLTYWVVHTMRTYGGLPLYLAVPLWFLLGAYLALYTGLFAGALAACRRSPARAMALAPVFWVAAEYLRGTLFTGFPWELLGYSQHRRLLLIQTADLAGPYGLSFLIVAVNAAGALFILRRRGLPWGADPAARAGRKGVIAAAALAAGLAGAAVAYGMIRIDAVDRAAAAADRLRATVVQGNVRQEMKWDPDHRDEILERYIRLSGEGARQGADLAIWPETATPFHFTHNRGLTRRVTAAADDMDLWLLAGTPFFTRNALGEAEFYNSAHLMGPDGRIAGRYDKVHLVPYGEYVPLQRYMPFIGKLVAQVGDFQTGEKGRVLLARTGGAGGGASYGLGTLICYEIIFPDLARAAAAGGANLLANLTNDAWYGRTSAPFQHFSMAVFRAVENRRALARAANTGISGFIDPAGRVIASTELFETAAVTRPLPLMRGMAFYTRFGDIFAMACLAGAALAAIVRGWPRLRRG